MMEMIETIIAIIVIDFFIVWFAKAFEKFNRLKAEHRQHAKDFAELVNGKDAIEQKSHEEK